LAFATPRSWEQVSNILSIGYNDEELAQVLSGCVGNGVSTEFMAFRKYYESLPDFRKIMSGDLKYKVPTDRGVCFALTTSLIHHLVDNSYGDGAADKIKNLGKVMEQLDDDFLIMAYKTVKGVVVSRNKDNVEKSISCILQNTVKSFKRVSKYIKYANED